MANTKVTGDLIASGTITAANLVSGTLDTLLNSYLTTNTYATQGYVTTAVNNLIDAAPASLNTLNELAAALNDDANFATTVTNSLATKLNLSGGTMTGALITTSPLTIQDSTPYIQWKNASGTRLGYIQHNETDLVMSADTGDIGLDANTNVFGNIKSEANEGKLILNSTAANGKQYEFISIDTGNFGLYDGTAYRLWVGGNGNIGIGTTSPSQKLDVRGYVVSDYNSNGSLSGFFLGNTSHGLYRANLNNDIVLYTTSGDVKLSANTSSVTQMIVKNNGTVSVGTTGYSVGGQPSGTNGRFNVYTAQGSSEWAQQIRHDSSTGNGLFVRAGGNSSYYTAYLTGYDENNVHLVVRGDGNVGIGTSSPIGKLQVGAHTFTGGNGVYTDGRIGSYVAGSLTSMVYASTYNDSTYPDYGMVFIHGPNTSSYNVWSISPDGPAKGDGLNFIYGKDSTNIHTATPKVVFDGNGYVGIGDNTPDYRLVVSGTGTERVRVGSTNNTTAGVYFTVKSGGSLVGNGTIATQNNGDMRFFTGTNSESEKMRLLAGGGLTFNGDTTAANALDDYEEGTWSPEIIRNGGTIAASYTAVSSYATYVKIGRLVYIKCFVTELQDGSSNGSSYWRINNVPFAGTPYAGAKFGYSNMTADGFYIGDAGGNLIITSNNAPYYGSLGSGKEFMIAFCYETNS